MTWGETLKKLTVQLNVGAKQLSIEGGNSKKEGDLKKEVFAEINRPCVEEVVLDVSRKITHTLEYGGKQYQQVEVMWLATILI